MMLLTQTELVTLMEDVSVETGPAELHYVLQQESAKVAGNRVTDVHILGFTSKNGYEYSQEAVKDSMHLYEGAAVFTNHQDPKNKSPRNVQDKVGFLENVRYEADSGLWGDIVCNEAHAFYESFKWWADNHPSEVGLSHDAKAKYSRTTKMVEQIVSVASVDIVCNPATVKGLHECIQEGVIDDKITEDKALKRFHHVIETAIDLIYQSKYDISNINVRASNIKAVSEDLTSIMREFEEPNVLQTNPVTNPTESVKEEVDNNEEGEAVEFTELDIKVLEEKRPDLVKSIREEQIALREDQDARVQEALKAIPERLRTDYCKKQVRAFIEADNKEGLKEFTEDRNSLASTTGPKSKGLQSVSESTQTETTQESTNDNNEDVDVMALFKK